MPRFESGRPAGAAGFTLLEAIVALVIFSLAAFSLYAWQGTNLRTLARVEKRGEALRDQRAILAMVDTINPMMQPKGQRELGDMSFRWTSSPVDGPRPGKTSYGRPSLFDVGLYELQVEIIRNGEVTTQFVVRQVGYRQTRHIDDE